MLTLQFHAVEWLPSSAAGPEWNSSEREVPGPCRTTRRKHAQCLVEGTHQTRMDVRLDRGMTEHSGR